MKILDIAKNYYVVQHAILDAKNLNLIGTEREAFNNIRRKIDVFKLRRGIETINVNIYEEGTKKRVSPNWIGEKPLKYEQWTLKDYSSFISTKEPLKTLLFLLSARLDSARIIEIGTAYGISAMHLTAGISTRPKESKNRATFIERNSYFLPYARENLSHWPEKYWILEHADGAEFLNKNTYTYSLAFLDAAHNPDGKMRLFKAMLPHLVSGAVLLVDDILWPTLINSWGEMKKHPRTAKSLECFNRCGILILK